MLRISHCLDSRLTDGGEVSPMHQLRCTPLKHYYFYVSGTHFCLRLSKPQGLVRPEGLGDPLTHTVLMQPSLSHCSLCFLLMLMEKSDSMFTVNSFVAFQSVDQPELVVRPLGPWSICQSLALERNVWGPDADRQALRAKRIHGRDQNMYFFEFYIRQFSFSVLF
jgi:hypothetical protein